MPLKIIVIFLLLVVIASLGSALFYLLTDKDASNRAVKALSMRIAISITAFLLLIIGYLTGVIQPHGAFPPANPGQAGAAQTPPVVQSQ